MFVPASFAALAAPGSVLAVLAENMLRHGSRVAVATWAGIMLGRAVNAAIAVCVLLWAAPYMTRSLQVLALIGAAYLVWLAVRSIVRWGGVAVDRSVSARGPAIEGLVVAASSPVTLTLLLTMLPQFLRGDDALAPQIALLTAIHLSIAFAVTAGWLALLRLGRDRLRTPRMARFARWAVPVTYLSMAVLMLSGSFGQLYVS